jgi:hypothetical protein
MSRQVKLTTIIAAANVNSPMDIEIQGAQVVALITDADFAGAWLRPWNSIDGGSSSIACSDANGNQVEVTIGASECVRVDPHMWGFFDIMQLGSSLVQPGGTPTTITIVVLAD